MFDLSVLRLQDDIIQIKDVRCKEYRGCSLLCVWKVGVHFEKSNCYRVFHIIYNGIGYINPNW